MLKMIFAAGAPLALTLCVAATLAAQGPGGPRPDGPPPSGGPHAGGRPPFAGPPLERLLDLNDEQKATFETLKREQHEAARPLLEEQKRIGDQLRQALDSPKPDATAVGRAMIAMRELRRKLDALRDQVDERLLAVLDDQQKQKFQLLREMHEEGRRNGPSSDGPGRPARHDHND